MSNALGIGANTALGDATLLADEILAVARGDKDRIDGVAAYEKVMRDVGYAASRRSAQVGQYVIGHRPLPA